MSYPTPTVRTEAEAAQLAMGGERGVAWPTVLLFTGNIAVWAASGYAAITHAWPLWLCFLLSTVAIYVNYTPLHEAVHGNIAGNDKRFRWLNDAIGTIARIIFFHGFALHRITHLAHHANTNDAARDPDHWAHGPASLNLLWRCLTILVPHERFGWRLATQAANGRSTIVRALAERTVSYGGMLLLILTGHTDAALAAFAAPAIVGSGFLAFLFDWAVHHPHDKPVSDRYRATSVFLFPAPVHGPLTALYLWQNYHLIHHLFPRVPFYEYGRLFASIRPLLEVKGSPITTLGRAA